MREKIKTNKLTFEELVRTIESRLRSNLKIRRTLTGGRIHIDRSLPFLCVFRHPQAGCDDHTRHLVMGEASYLIASGDADYHRSLSMLLLTVVKTLSAKFGAFLLLEIWPADRISPVKPPSGKAVLPSFRIMTRDRRYGALSSTLLKLEETLKQIRVLKAKSQIEINYRKDPTPPKLKPLLSAADAKRFRCYVVGLEIAPIYRSTERDEHYPLVLQTLHHGLSRAFKQTFYEFASTQTSQKPGHYQTLGRRAMVKAVWEADRRLAEVNHAFDFLLLATPVNTDVAWNYFRRKHFDRVPIFYYRPIPLDPVLIKRRLFDIPITRIEDPTLSHLFREKQHELDQKLTMLTYRSTRNFLYGSLQLYGGVDDKLYDTARKILKRFTRERASGGRPKPVNAEIFARRARQEIEFLRGINEIVRAEVRIREDIVGNFVLHGDLLVGLRSQIPPDRVEALIQHEIGTHLLTYYNGKAQPFLQLQTGLAGYEGLQEGLAVLAEYLVGGLSPSRWRVLAARILAIKDLIDGCSFIEAFQRLVDQHGFDARMAFNIVVRVYRGGGLTKDLIYLQGLTELLTYLKTGGELEPLFVGKIALSHVGIIQELLARKVLKPPPLMPRYMHKRDTLRKLEQLKRGIDIHELMEKE